MRRFPSLHIFLIFIANLAILPACDTPAPEGFSDSCGTDRALVEGDFVTLCDERGQPAAYLRYNSSRQIRHAIAFYIVEDSKDDGRRLDIFVDGVLYGLEAEMISVDSLVDLE